MLLLSELEPPKYIFRLKETLDMNGKLLGLVSGAAVLAFSISATPAKVFAGSHDSTGWDLSLDLNGNGTFSGLLSLPVDAPYAANFSVFKLKDWTFTYAPSTHSNVGQFTLDASNSDVEVLYCESCNQDADKLEVIVRICCTTV